MFQILKINQGDENFPERLKNISDAPDSIYVRGDILEQDNLAIAIVGSRKCTSYGKQIAYDFAYELAKNGVTIISGLALGIDGEAHKGALDAGGRTLAVLGSGIDEKSIYPYSHKSLAERVLENGALISEYEVGTPALPHHFPERNRIVSGLSRGVIVVEGLKKSGTLLTASAAAEQGRTVFAVPGQITSPLSQAPHFLIQNGAKLVGSSQDILEELDLQFKVDRDEVEKVLPGNEIEVKLWQILENEPLHLDEIARISTIEMAEVSARLTVMEIKGMVRNIGNGVYKKI